MLKVWGRRNSINVQKAMWTIGELGLAHEHTDAGGAFGGLDDPAYLAMNPMGRIPVIDDDGMVVWESNAIVRYLVAKHSDGALWPADPAARSLADRWMEWQGASLAIDMFTVFWGLIRTPEAERDMAAIDAGTGRLNDAMTVLDAHLADRDWVGGAAMTMGDLAVGPTVYRWLAMPIQRPDLANLNRYYDVLTSRPAFAEHVMIPLS